VEISLRSFSRADYSCKGTPTGLHIVRLEVLKAVGVTNTVSLVVHPCGSNRAQCAAAEFSFESPACCNEGFSEFCVPCEL
jgi:hypothetical protein